MDENALVTEANTLLTEMRTKFDAAIARDKKLYERLGLDYDKEEKTNILAMGEKVIDLEVQLQKLRRARAGGIAEGAPEEGKTYFEDPVEEAQYQIRGTKEYRRALNRALRKGGDGWKGLDQATTDLLSFKAIPERIAENLAPEVKSALSTDFDPGAGFFAPATMESEIDKFVLESSPLGDLARVVTIGTGSYEGLIRTLNRDNINKRGEREARTGSDTQLKRYEKRRIEVYESEASPALTQTQLEDSVIDLAGELQADASEDFAIDEGRKFIHGTGVDEPEGLMVSPDILVMPSGLASTFDMDGLKKLPQQLKIAYKTQGAYLLSRPALTLTLLFREGTAGVGTQTGGYLWQPSAQAGIPSNLNGYGWREAVDMDDVVAGAFPVAFGAWSQAYRIVRRRGIRIIRDELTQKPFIVFYMTKRFGGRVWKGEAAVKMKIAVS